MSAPLAAVEPAHDLEAERAVLGAVLSNAELPDLKPDEFYHEENRIVWEAILHLHHRDEPTDLVTVRQQLETTGGLEAVGGMSKVSELVDSLADVANVGAYADIIRDKAATREAVKVARRVAGGGDIEAVSNELKGIADRQAAGRRGLTVRRVDELLAMELPPPEPIVTGLVSTDEILQVVAFRGTGKTYLGLTLAVAIAAGVDPVAGWSVPTARPTLYIDGELPLVRLRDRIGQVCIGLGVDPATLPMFTISKTDTENRGQFLSLSTPEGRAEISGKVDELAAEHGMTPVLFLDSLATLLDASDENSRESFQPVGEWLIGLRGRGVLPVFFHHTGWSQEHGRGTSAREDLIDTSIRLRSPGDKPSTDGARFELIFDKARNLGPGEARGFELRLEAAPRGGVIFSRSEIGERQAFDIRAAIADTVADSPGCSLNYVYSVIDARKQEICKQVNKMVAIGELLNEGEGQSFKLVSTGSGGGERGPVPGTGSRTGTGSGENPMGTNAEPVGNRSGTGSGTGTGSPVPTPTGGGGNRLGNTAMCKLPLTDPETWPADPRYRLVELERGGMKRAAAIAKVRAEHEGEHGGDR